MSITETAVNDTPGAIDAWVTKEPVEALLVLFSDGSKAACRLPDGEAIAKISRFRAAH